MADDDGWKSKVFSVENAGPWLILIVVLSFEALATLPREDLPPLGQRQLISLVLSMQYRRRNDPAPGWMVPQAPLTDAAAVRAN